MIRFELVTLDGVKFGDKVHEVMLPTPDGYVAIFEHHVPLVSLATPGIITIRRNEHDTDERLEHFATNGGVIEVINNTVRLLADEASHAEEINEEEARKAYERARDLLREAKDQQSLDHAQSMIDRSRVRIKVADLRRKRRR
jgi:F-type H+-transporting ATPase subunit epsilon